MSKQPGRNPTDGRSLTIAKHPPSKKCSMCKARKPLASFHRKSNSKDGRTAACATCRNKRSQYYLKQSAGGFEHRKPAFEHDYRCQMCGMGHDSQVESDNCCERQRELPPMTGTAKSKFGYYAGDQDWKYTRARRLAKGLEGLGEVH